jgi:flagellar biosynthetic protein FlhB
MSDDSAERTEEPTGRRLSKAIEEGDVARSMELPAAAVMIAGAVTMALMGSWWVSRFAQQMRAGFTFDRKTLDTPTLLPTTFLYAVGEGLLVVLPLMVVTAVVAIAASGVTGGFHFSAKAFAPKFSKLSPISGVKRMFGTHALVELIKAIGKFSVVSLVLWWLINRYLVELMRLANMGLEPALGATGEMIMQSVIWLTLSLLVIAAIDAPYQRWSYFKKLRMTKQEIKDEMKDSEGRPEVKQQIRRRQREMSNARMIAKVKDADVVITNPEHFAVALSYDPTADGAPILLAKGADHIAARIREEARQNGVEMFSSPQLARALYFTTEVDQPIPESLYHAVAPVIAYVFSLAQVRPGVEPMAKPNPEVPPSMRFDAEGRLESA